MVNMEDYSAIQRELFSMQDTKYRDFQAKLMPGVDPERIIGVRTPALRVYGKQLYKEGVPAAFWEELPHRYYEENNLHAFFIEQIRDYDACIAELDRFLPYVDNWATCDMMRPKCLKKHRDRLVGEIRRWLADPHPYTVRFGIEMLMVYYLEEAFAPEYPAMVAAVVSEGYYVNMMIAWYFATALAKQYEAVLPYLKENRLSPWVHNKTIQKAVDSYRITEEQKQYLRGLKRK